LEGGKQGEGQGKEKREKGKGKGKRGRERKREKGKKAYHSSLQVIALPIRKDVGDDQDAQKEHDRFKRLKVQRHRLVNDPP